MRQRRRRTETETQWRWKAIYRLLRIASRESMKAATDCMLYGTGLTHVDGKTGETRHIPWSEFRVCHLAEPEIPTLTDHPETHTITLPFLPEGSAKDRPGP